MTAAASFLWNLLPIAGRRRPAVGSALLLFRVPAGGEPTAGWRRSARLDGGRR